MHFSATHVAARHPSCPQSRQHTPSRYTSAGPRVSHLRKWVKGYTRLQLPRFGPIGRGDAASYSSLVVRVAKTYPATGRKTKQTRPETGRLNTALCLSETVSTCRSDETTMAILPRAAAQKMLGLQQHPLPVGGGLKQVDVVHRQLSSSLHRLQRPNHHLFPCREETVEGSVSYIYGTCFRRVT